MRRINPKSIIPYSYSSTSNHFNFYIRSQQDLYRVDLSTTIQDMKDRPSFSMGGVASTLVVDLVTEAGSIAMSPYLSQILHFAFIQMDHFITIISDQMRILLVNVIDMMFPNSRANAKFDNLIARVKNNRTKRLWLYEDISPRNRVITSFKEMGDILDDVISLLYTVDPSLHESWRNIALSYAVGSQVRHIACRSLQIFRLLKPTFNQRILGDLLNRLSTTIADPAEELQ
jgi:hypothetical protein